MKISRLRLISLAFSWALLIQGSNNLTASRDMVAAIPTLEDSAFQSLGSVLGQSSCADPYPPASATYSENPGSEPNPSISFEPVINISRAEYDVALTKWNSQGISEYEMVVEHVAYFPRLGILTLRVRGDRLKIINELNDGVPIEPNPYLDAEQVRLLTIKELFASVDEILTHGLCEMKGEWAYPITYTILFDPMLRYPSRIERRGSIPDHWHREGRWSSAPAHSSFWTEVQSLKVLKRSMPGMPKTGNPGP